MGILRIFFFLTIFFYFFYSYSFVQCFCFHFYLPNQYLEGLFESVSYVHPLHVVNFHFSRIFLSLHLFMSFTFSIILFEPWIYHFSFCKVLNRFTTDSSTFYITTFYSLHLSFHAFPRLGLNTLLIMMQQLMFLWHFSATYFFYIIYGVYCAIPCKCLPSQGGINAS